MTTNSDDFWGSTGDWPEAPEGARREPRPGVGSTVSRWWNNVLGGGSSGNRAHRGRHATTAPVDLEDEPLSINPSGEHPVVRPSGEVPVIRPTGADRTGPTRRPTRPAPPAAADTPSDSIGDAWDDDWEVTPDEAPTPKPGVDPLLARLGGAAIVLTLMVPLFLGVGGSGDDDPASDAAIADPTITLLAPSADATAAATTPIVPDATAAAAETETVVETTAPATAAATVATTAAAPAVTAAPAAAADQAPAATTQVIASGALASSTAEREQSCAIDYTVVAGDFWLRLADEAGVPIEQLLDANDATSDTPLYPGSTVCLPQGSSMPSPPTTQAPATTTKPVATTPAPTAPAATTPTTVKPVVTYPALSGVEVQQIIRDVWPDELEDRAIEIAWRESNFIPTAQNSCCYGVFQMHWEAHDSWLAGLGITSPEQLFDVTNNAYAAYALYQRSGGWGPWT